LNPTVITSRDNSLLRQARAVRDGKVDNLIFVEGLRLCEEAFRSGLPIEAVIYSDEIAQKERAATLVNALSRLTDRLVTVSENLLRSISYTKTPQGIIALASKPQTGVEKLTARQSRSPLLVITHTINNPVNVGAILRTAEAAGATGAIITEHSADPFSPKAIRGAMGSSFRLPMWIGPSLSEVLEWCAARDIHTICADAHASRSYMDVDWKRPCALILGPESTGLLFEEIASASGAVRIPMHEPVESLNVAVAAAIVLYEAARQRA
jgi:RNA methyltransferase, TrmH family